MSFKPFLAVLFFAAFSHNYAQSPKAEKTPNDTSVVMQKQISSNAKKTAETNDHAISPQTLPDPYVRPDAKRRMKNYVNSVVGTVALVQYLASPALLTARNSPKEWGGKWDGFGKRIASTAGKSFVSNTTTYALDELLRLDSNFYRSQDRSVKARLSNAALSTFTARKTDGKRVVGIPRIAGSFLSEVVSSVTWYPPRYNYVHGLKGGAISLGINTGFNLFREFIWKK